MENNSKENTTLSHILEQLDIELNVAWESCDKINYPETYHIDFWGNINVFTNTGGFLGVSNDLWKDIIVGKLKPQWKPRESDAYYIPFITQKESARYISKEWCGSQSDIWKWDNNLVFRTKKEAIEAANEALLTLKMRDK